MTPRLAFDGIGHSFGVGATATAVIQRVDFDVAPGEFVAVIGPSGCGKTTLLQIAAGLLQPTAGEVRQDGVRIAGVRAGLGFVPQQALLFPWKTLGENVALPLVVRGVDERAHADRVARMLVEVGLDGFAEHYPHQLSGGMQKRGAIARTLIDAPDTILMDEPFGALDAQTRMVMQDDLQTLVARQGASVVLVTHDIGEAILLADRVVILSRRPARVIGTVPIGLERPRDMFEPYLNEGFQEAYAQVWGIFSDQAPKPRR